MRYPLVLLDFDGTMCHTEPAIFYCTQEILRRFGTKTFTDAEIVQHIGLGLHLEKSFKILISPELSDQEIAHIIHTYREIYREAGLERTQLYEGVSAVLEELRAAGTHVAIVSNKFHKSIENALHKFALSPYINLIVGDKPGARIKPDPHIFTEIIKPQFPQISPEEVLFVGDTEIDMLFAKNIGCDACWVSYGYGKEQACLPHKPKHIIHNFSELLAL